MAPEPGEEYTEEQIQEFEKTRMQDPQKAEDVAREVQESMDSVLDLQRKANLLREVGAEKEATGFENAAKSAAKKADERMTILGEKYDLSQITDPKALVSIRTQLDIRANQLNEDIALLQDYTSTPEVIRDTEKTKKALEKINELAARAKNLSIKHDLISRRIRELEEPEEEVIK